MTDVMAAILADAGFESFVPDSNGLTAYIRESDYTPDMESLSRTLPFDVKTSWTATKIEGQDWNHEWEKNYFKPIVVADQCVIHSSFHTDIPQCRYDIVIDPKMAFGTGHHSTTWLMISHLLEINPEGLNVIDMGTGTGILAILAAMRGAARVTGIEIDEPAWINAVENTRLNTCQCTLQSRHISGQHQPQHNHGRHSRICQCHGSGRPPVPERLLHRRC